MTQDHSDPRLKKLFSRAAEAHGTDEAALYAELQSLCDTVRRTDPSFPKTPEQLITALLLRLKSAEIPEAGEKERKKTKKQ